jgi:hypothetical protein
MPPTKTVSLSRPRTISSRTRAAVGGRKSSIKRRPGDRRAATAEGRRAEAARAAARKPSAAPVGPALRPETKAPLSEEEQIESAKYLPRHVPSRVFEEERFLFPETYGVDRVRLLVKDPEWLFAYWDLSARAVDSLRRELGERGVALARLTLRITDPGYGGTSVILLPYGARNWYVRADDTARSYRATLGWTLPSGQFRPLADSNVVTTPRVGPSPFPATRWLPYTADLAAIRAAAGPDASTNPGPWSTEPFDAEAATGGRKRRGGASDSFRPPSAGKLNR